MASTYTYSIRRLISYTCHDSDQDVFLDGERTGVYSDTEYLFARHNVCPRPPNRERDKLGNDLAEPKTLSLPNSKVKSSRSTYGSDSDGDRILIIGLADDGRQGAYGKVLPIGSNRIAIHATTLHGLLLDRIPHSENSPES